MNCSGFDLTRTSKCFMAAGLCAIIAWSSQTDSATAKSFVKDASSIGASEEKTHPVWFRLGYLDFGRLRDSIPTSPSLRKIAAQFVLSIERDVDLCKSRLQEVVAANDREEAYRLEQDIRAKQLASLQVAATREVILSDNISLNAKRFARERNLDIVVDPSAVFVGKQMLYSNGEDITNSIFDELTRKRGIPLPFRLDVPR
jgi:hypothetical protein